MVQILRLIDQYSQSLQVRGFLEMDIVLKSTRGGALLNLPNVSIKERTRAELRFKNNAGSPKYNTGSPKDHELKELSACLEISAAFSNFSNETNWTISGGYFQRESTNCVHKKVGPSP